MDRSSRSIREWLEARFINNQNGIIIEQTEYDSFNLIHDFLEEKDHSHKTHAIYYDAFDGESAAEFLSILAEELSSKLGQYKSGSESNPSVAIAQSELRMVIIDQCYFHAPEITNDLLTWFNRHNVCLILVGAESKIKSSQFMNHPGLAKLAQCQVDTICFCRDTALAAIS